MRYITLVPVMLVNRKFDISSLPSLTCCITYVTGRFCLNNTFLYIKSTLRKSQ